jgi:gamma-glutamyl:cysteine ligase YbdK (ATP-grasp superfamily)
MDPRTETTLWTASDAAIYATYDRLFDCRRHGWANLQSMHINLPFADDREFERLHTAIRLVLPLIPALAASSPIANGKPTGHRDYRLLQYATHTSRFPSITGDIIPDVVHSRREYEQQVLNPMYDDVAEVRPDGRVAP